MTDTLANVMSIIYSDVCYSVWLIPATKQHNICFRCVLKHDATDVRTPGQHVLLGKNKKNSCVMTLCVAIWPSHMK